MPGQISPIAAGNIPAPIQEPSASKETADKITQFFTRIEGFGTVFSLLAGAAVALLWGVQFGLIAGFAGIALSLAISLCRSSETSPSPAPAPAPELTEDGYPILVIDRHLAEGVVDQTGLPSFRKEPRPDPAMQAEKARVAAYKREHGAITTAHPSRPKTKAEEYAIHLAQVEAENATPSPAPREVPNVKARDRSAAVTVAVPPARPVAARRFSPAENLRIYQETMAYADQHFAADNLALEEGASVITKLPPITTAAKYPDMRVYVANMSTLRMTEDLVNRGLKPLFMNMANAYDAGGGVRRGATAQEEIVCRQSNSMKGLLKIESAEGYPIPECGGILLPSVVLFRGDPSDGYAYLDDPIRAGEYAVAAFICNPDYKGSPGFRPASNEEYRAKTAEKIKNYFRAAIMNGYDSIVPSALGCGAFKNDPIFMANLFKEILAKPEFKGQFKEVAFGIIEDAASGGVNFSTFRDILGGR